MKKVFKPRGQEYLYHISKQEDMYSFPENPSKIRDNRLLLICAYTLCSSMSVRIFRLNQVDYNNLMEWLLITPVKRRT